MPRKEISVLNLKQFKTPANAQPDLYIKTFQEHKKEHPFVMEPHSHDFYLLMLFTNGSGKHTIDADTYSVKPGSFFFMSPSEAHAWTLSERTDGYILMFNSVFYQMDFKARSLFDLPFFSTKNKIRAGILDGKQIMEMEALFKSMIHENETDSMHQKTILRSYLNIVLLKLATALNDTAHTKIIPGSGLLIPQLESLIEQHFNQHQPVSFYADKLNISASQLNALTKKYSGKTVMEISHERLLAEAKRLLAYSFFSVSEIAYQLNFTDNSYFNRFFKKLENCTPQEFRKRLN